MTWIITLKKALNKQACVWLSYVYPFRWTLIWLPLIWWAWVKETQWWAWEGRLWWVGLFHQSCFISFCHVLSVLSDVMALRGNFVFLVFSEFLVYKQEQHRPCEWTSLSWTAIIQHFKTLALAVTNADAFSFGTLMTHSWESTIGLFAFADSPTTLSTGGLIEAVRQQVVKSTHCRSHWQGKRHNNCLLV